MGLGVLPKVPQCWDSSPNPKVPLGLALGAGFREEESLGNGSQLAGAQSSHGRKEGVGCCVHRLDGPAQSSSHVETRGHLACLQWGQAAGVGLKPVPTGDRTTCCGETRTVSPPASRLPHEVSHLARGSLWYLGPGMGWRWNLKG